MTRANQRGFSFAGGYDVAVRTLFSTPAVWIGWVVSRLILGRLLVGSSMPFGDVRYYHVGLWGDDPTAMMEYPDAGVWPVRLLGWITTSDLTVFIAGFVVMCVLIDAALLALLLRFGGPRRFIAGWFWVFFGVATGHVLWLRLDLFPGVLVAGAFGSLTEVYGDLLRGAGAASRLSELLQASGLEVLADVSGGMGVSVCRLEGQGCDFPVQHCFCQCMGGADCAYWNYFYREAGAETWTYSPLGAGLHTVLPGFVDAWVWGDGRTPPAADLTFEAICQPPTPTAVATEAATATPPPATTGSATSATATAPPPATATPAAVAQAPAAGHPAEAPAAPSPAAAAPDGAGGTGGYLAFGGMLLVLAAAGVVVWLRRR